MDKAMIVIAAAAFVVASVLDVKTTMEGMKFPGAYERFPIYRWPPWRKGPFVLWMYVASAAAVLALAVWKDLWGQLLVVAAIRFFAGLYWNPRQIRKAKER